MKLKRGQMVMFEYDECALKARVYELGFFVGSLDIPPVLSIQKGTAFTFLDAEAAKVGLTVVPLASTPYAFSLK
jgi:hypothetical protein